MLKVMGLYPKFFGAMVSIGQFLFSKKGELAVAAFL
jgi:hypothetical protein